MKSLWNCDCKLTQRKPLQKDIDVQTVVIGAGMAGILTAYFLKKKGMNVIVVEAKNISGGQTERTTAKITSQHGMIYDKLIRKVGREKARLYAKAHENAIQVYEQIIREERIECHFEKKPAYLYTLLEENKEALKREAKVAKELGIQAQFIETEFAEAKREKDNAIAELPFDVKAAVCFENQAQFHPLEFMKKISEDIVIYENTKVLSVKKHTVLTNRGKIEAGNIVFATHYPVINVPGFYFMRQHQERSYVLALNGASELSGMYYGIDENGISLRSEGNVLLLGGGGHRTGKQKGKVHIGNLNCAEVKKGYAYLREVAKTYYPDLTEIVAWAAQDCMPHDELPFIGKYSVLRPYWYVASGFKKWGMTSAMVAALTISNQISNQIGSGAQAYENIFTPQRFLFRAAIKNIIIDVIESVLGLGKGLFTPKERRCPHMGCKLEWNAQEGSYDCPCHGSRFSSEGELEDNPAQIDLKNKNRNR